MKARSRRSWRSPIALPDLVTRAVGSRAAAAVATVAVVATICLGVAMGFSHGWQTAVYASAGLISVLMLFLLQHTTNRHNNAVLAKLDELLQATPRAREEFIELEDRQLADQEELHRKLMRPADDGRDV